jgi:hypothetical protein
MFEILRSGGKVQRSGIYKAIHAQQHAEPHYVTVLSGDMLPSCLTCSMQIRFELAIPADHVNAHPHFRRVI